VEEGYEAAKYVGLNLCATLKHNLGDLDRVKRVVKLLALVNCVDGFTQQPAVVNGCSDLFVKVFGEKGQHTRSALGTNSLPLGVPVEIEAIFEIEPLKEKETEASK
jgi:enamine deaminase RidA (YjgF/YER057c/UK114 family)